MRSYMVVASSRSELTDGDNICSLSDGTYVTGNLNVECIGSVDITTGLVFKKDKLNNVIYLF